MEVDQVITGIVDVRNRITKAFESPGQLSDLAVRLATYNAYLGDHLSGYKFDREVMRGKRYLELINSGTSSTQATATSRAETADLQGNIQKLELIHRDAENLTSVIQSRMRVLEGQARNQT